MLIKELEKQTGLERATIRFYEKEGFVTPVRQENGYREYSDADSDTLLKIKLLRQLGMSLDMIRSLQQGSEDFSAVLADQICQLEHKIQDSARAREICIEIRDAGVSYDTLDPVHYLQELSRVSTEEPKWKPQPVPEFHRTQPVHPWRRYWARAIDYTILNAAKMFVMVVLLRIRPINDFAYTLIDLSIVTHLLWIPIEGLLLHYWGTTPGKWIMGIRVEAANGGNLSISAAIQRAFGVLQYGYGFTVPIYGYWRLYRSFADYTETGATPWDREQDTELQFEYYWSGRKKWAIAAAAAICAVVIGVSVLDTIKPVYRGEDLTVAQIAQNHNDILELYYGDSKPPVSMYLNENGTWRTMPSNSNVIIIGSKPVHENENYEYELENGCVRTIRYEQEWTDVVHLTPLGRKIESTVISVAAAQDWCWYGNLEEFSDLFMDAMKSDGNGSIRHENLELRWTAEAENCFMDTRGIYYTEVQDEPSSLKFCFELIIHETE